MTGIAQTGAQVQLNALTRTAIPVVQGTAPTWFPGLFWVNSSSGNSVNAWNGSSWAPVTNPYLAMLTADPSSQIAVAGLQECTDAGYSRVSISFTQASNTYPTISSNTGLVTFGPFSVNMSLPSQWLALVTSSSGTAGFLLATWTLSASQQVNATQTVNVAAGALTITQS